MQPSDFSGVNFCTNSGAMVADSGATTYDIVTAIDFCIDGVGYNKGTVSNGATPTTDGVTGVAFTTLVASQGCVLVWGLDTAGAVKVIQGEIKTLDSDGNFSVVPEPPPVPDTICPCMYQVLKADSTAGTITIGSSNWNATGFTNQIKNLLTLPSRPINFVS